MLQDSTPDTTTKTPRCTGDWWSFRSDCQTHFSLPFQCSDDCSTEVLNSKVIACAPTIAAEILDSCGNNEGEVILEPDIISLVEQHYQKCFTITTKRSTPVPWRSDVVLEITVIKAMQCIDKPASLQYRDRGYMYSPKNSLELLICVFFRLLINMKCKRWESTSLKLLLKRLKIAQS